MTSSETLIQAAFNLLKARMQSQLLTSVTQAKNLMQETPEKLKTEWNILKDEIINEAIRLDEEKKKEVSSKSFSNDQKDKIDTQLKIDQLRQKLAKLSKDIEAKN